VHHFVQHSKPIDTVHHLNHFEPPVLPMERINPCWLLFGFQTGLLCQRNPRTPSPMGKPGPFSEWSMGCKVNRSG
jgi:hypothetical protein